VEQYSALDDSGKCRSLELSGAFRGGSSGVPTEIRAWEVLWIVDGLVAKRELSWSKEAARDASGLPASAD
jgi:hypothetical protein